MTLFDMLECAQYNQIFVVYVTNIYDQNIPIGEGTRNEMLDEDEFPEFFSHLIDIVDGYEVTTKGKIIIRVRDENFMKNASELYSPEYVKRWDNLKPETRPWLHSAEVEK